MADILHDKDGKLSTELFNITARGMLTEEAEALIVIADITKREQMWEKLLESEEKYSSLVESTADSIYLVDWDCKYLFVNEKHLSRLGLPKDQVIGKTYGELHSEDETEVFAEIVDEVFKTGKSVQHEHRSRRDGRYVLRTLSPVKDPEGRTTAVTVVSKDIKGLKEAEKERKRLINELEAKNSSTCQRGVAAGARVHG